MRKNPNSNREYVLVYDHPPSPDGKDAVLVPMNTIVHNLQLTEKDGLEFTVKKDGKVYHTNYGYMFAENNEKNLVNLRNARKLREEYFEIMYKMERAFNEVDTVKGPY